MECFILIISCMVQFSYHHYQKLAVLVTNYLSSFDVITDDVILVFEQGFVRGLTVNGSKLILLLFQVGLVEFWNLLNDFLVPLVHNVCETQTTLNEILSLNDLAFIQFVGIRTLFRTNYRLVLA